MPDEGPSVRLEMGGTAAKTATRPSVVIGKGGERTYLPDGTTGDGRERPAGPSGRRIPLVFDWGSRVSADPLGETGRLLYGESVGSVARKKLSLVLFSVAGMVAVVCSILLLARFGRSPALGPGTIGGLLALAMFGAMLLTIACALTTPKVLPFLLFENGMALYWGSPSFHYRFFPWSQIRYYWRRDRWFHGPTVVVGDLITRVELIERLTDEDAVRYIKDHLVRTTRMSEASKGFRWALHLRAR